jgi:putative ABC transport system ATP-binding protein
MHQDCHLINHWSIAENMALVSRDRKTLQRWMQRFDLHMSPTALVEHLSGGERQRVALIRLFLQNPDLALLDEPTAHLDDDHTLEALKWIKSELRGKTVLIVSHDKRLIDQAEHLLDWKKEVHT